MMEDLNGGRIFPNKQMLQVTWETKTTRFGRKGCSIAKIIYLPLVLENRGRDRYCYGPKSSITQDLGMMWDYYEGKKRVCCG